MRVDIPDWSILMRRLAVRVGLVIGLGWSALAVRAQQPAPATPTFRAGADVVSLDVSVLDGHRVPVRGLTAGAFTVRIDGQLRPVVAFNPVELPVAPTTQANWTQTVQGDVTTVAPALVPQEEGRLVVVVFDRSIPPGEPMLTARRIATAAVNQLGPTDLAAVLYTGVGVPQDFTADRAQLLRTINSTDTGNVSSIEAREQQAVQAGALGQLSTIDPLQGGCYCGLCVPETVTHVADTLRDIPRRKSLLFIGDAVLWQQTDGDCGPRLQAATEKMFAALKRSNVTIYSLSPSGLDVVSPVARAGSPLTNRGQLTVQAASVREMQNHLADEASLHVLPDFTGGRVISEINDPQQDIPAIFAESASYYVIGVDISGAAHPDQIRTIDVAVSRSSVDVRARREYIGPASTPASAMAALAAPTPNLVPTSAWTLAASVAPFAVPGQPTPAVLVTLRVEQPVGANEGNSVAQGAAHTDRVVVVTGAFDELAHPRGEDQRTATVTMNGTGVVAFEMLSRLSLKPGHYEIRIGATGSDPADHGALTTPLDVPDFAKAALSLSGLVLSATSHDQTGPDDAFRDVLSMLPTARRAFARTETVAAFLRVYEGGSRPVKAQTVEASIRDTQDRTIWQRALPLGTDAFGAGRAADARVDLPIDQLDAGDYLLTIGANAEATERQARFSIH